MLKIYTLLAALATSLAIVQAQLGDIYYKIPNPFGDSSGPSLSASYFAIESFQVTVSASKKQTQTQVTEYFSLHDGLTFSTHRDQDEPSKVWALIGDGQQGKTYLVLNPESRTEFECELDHTHDHKHVFPWQYVYDDDQHLPERKKNKRNGKPSKRFVYGVGGIWLNAIKRNLVTNEVDEDSPYPYANLWLMREGDLDIKLLFEKPKKRGDMEKLIAATKLETIQIKRQRALDRDHDRATGNMIGEETEHITVQSFKGDITYVTSSELRRFFKQLSRCRKDTERHRLFPSLMKAMSLSPKRLYAIEYLETKYARYQKDHVPSGSFDEAKNRHVWDVEFNSEWFSLKKESQITIYEGLPKEQADLAAANNGHKFIAEVFLKRFTENEKGRSSRHSTVSYHFIEQDGLIDTCKVGDNEPLPRDHLMVRPIHFHRDETGAQLTGKLTGVGALIMNVADIHYKQFSLSKREILVANDPGDLYSKTKMTVDEWQIFDQKTGRNLHFYFREKLNDHEAHEITDLVRIDIRDAKSVDLTDSIIEKANEDNEYDVDMMVRFDIINFLLDEDESEIEVLFTAPKVCNEQRPAPSDNVDDDDDDSEKSDDEDADEIFNDDDDYGKKYDSTNSGSDEDNDQNGGEDFELDAGKMMESTDFPDFFEFLDGQAGYQMESAIEMEGKKIILREMVDVEKEWAVYSIFLDGKLDYELDTEYYVNYKSELIFKTNGERDDCRLVDDVEPWFRLLSEKMTYLKSSGSGEVIIESNKLRLFGLSALWRRASDSLYTDFVGMKKEVVEGPRGHKFKPVIWSMMDDGDQDMELEFTFLWNQTCWERDALKKRNRRSFEMLSLDSVRMLPPIDATEPTSFKEFTIKLNTFTKSRSTELVLPVSCQKVLIEAAHKEAAQTEFEQGDLSIPSLSDYLGISDTYVIKYTVGHTIMNQDANRHLQTVTESYDKKRNKGKITVGTGEDTVEIFIDGANKAIYSFARNICKKITTIKTLVDLGPLFSAENPEFSMSKMWGLAALWIRISRFGNASLKVLHRHDRSGNRYEVRTYKASSTWSDSLFDITKYTIYATFVTKPPQASGNFAGLTPSISDRSDDKPTLQRLDFVPEQVRGVTGFSLHRSQVNIKSISRDKPINWDLPGPCIELAANTDDKPETEDFPRLRKYVQLTNKFHMRSEVTLSKPMINEEKVIFLIDEWLFNKNVRMTTHGLNSNIDFILYGDSMEIFDLSHPYRCLSTIPRFGPTDYSPKSDLALKRFWNDDTSLVEVLSNLYYGPTSLWWLAEKNIQNVKLENSIDIAPKPNSRADSKIDSLAKEMQSEVWKVTSPPDALKTWSYKLHFEKYSLMKDGATVREWHVLQRVELEEPDILGLRKFVEIDVINYSWDQSKREMTDKFLLPEGYGCTRSPTMMSKLSENPEELVLEPDYHYTLSYEATLELLPDKFSIDSQTGDYVELKDKLVSPTLIGTYVKSGRLGIDFYMDVSAHYDRVRYLNGTMTSTKTVYDNSRSLVYEIDRLTGYCRIGSITKASKYLKLDFPMTDTHKESVEFDDATLELMFLKSAKNKDLVPLNRYISEGRTITSYEQTLKDFKLTDNLVGFATLTRRYASSFTVKKHSSMSVQILLFNEAKTKVRAIFNIAVQRVWNTNLAEVIRTINVAQCYNDGDPTSDKKVRSFVMDYSIGKENVEIERFRHSVSNQASVDFVKMLMKQGSILATQLDGMPRVEFGHNGIARFYFSLLERPTAIEYFTRRPGYTMSDKMAADAEIKLVSSVIECSKWCDEIGCIGMSYCGDRTCRVITSNMLETTAQGGKSLPFLLELVKCVPNPDCVYFSKIAMQPKTLEAFSNSMDTIVNDAQDYDERSKLALIFSNSVPNTPIAFHDLKKNSRWISEDTKSTEEGTAATTPSKMGATYRVLKHDHRIDASQLAQSRAGFEAKVEQVHSYNECLNKCKIADCTMTSYCSQDNSCLVVTGRADVKQLESSCEPEQGGCSITVRDFLASYSRFEDTLKPASFEQQLDGYSALECASACDVADGDGESQFNCLSFDSCTSKSPADPKSSGGDDQAKPLTRSVCYLQKQHIMQDSFDRMILESANSGRQKAGNKQEELVCDHYSKSVLADYDRIANRMFMKSESAVRGSSAERCALDCQEDDECRAFEYCFDDNIQPSQTCYFIRTSELRRPENPANDNWRADFEKLLKVSKHCSIYTFKHYVERYELDTKTHTVALLDSIQAELLEKSPNFFGALLATLGYFLAAILVGSALQIAFIKIRGRPLALIN